MDPTQAPEKLDAEQVNELAPVPPRNSLWLPR